MHSQSRLWKYDSRALLATKRRKMWGNRNWLWSNPLMLGKWKGCSSSSKRWTSYILLCLRTFHISSWNGFLKHNPSEHCSGCRDWISASVLDIFLIAHACVRSSQFSFPYFVLFAYRSLKLRTEGQESCVSVGLSSLYSLKKTSAWRDTWTFHIKLLKYNSWLQEIQPDHNIFLLWELAIH